jgi:glyoxylase-like metal-dependent hydrolase (beta-lactamase superfamily II)
LRIGEIDVQALRDGAAVEFAGDVLSRPDMLDAWRCHPDQFGADGQWSFPLGAFVIRTGDRIILVDAGAGTHDDGRYVSGSLLESLRIHGLQPSDITDVVFTHLHWDHVGWATHGGDVVFPAATYRVHHADWERFVAGPTAVPTAIEKLMPIAPQLELFERDVTVAPGIDAVHSPGHTPGSTVYVLSSGSGRAILLGDVAHSVVVLAERDWHVIWDVDPVAASLVRNRIADEVADSQDLVVGAHFPEMKFGRVVTTGGTRRFIQV